MTERVHSSRYDGRGTDMVRAGGSIAPKPKAKIKKKKEKRKKPHVAPLGIPNYMEQRLLNQRAHASSHSF